MAIDWRPLIDIIRRRNRFLITSHLRADCDAIGSEMALARILDSLGKHATIVNGDEVPQHIQFLDPDGRVGTLGSTVMIEALRGFDAMIVVDTSAAVQLGRMAEVLRSFPGVRVVIDHHVSEDDLGAVVFKDDQAEATGRLILELAEALRVEITPQIAEPLLTAIATDTGWFRFSSVTERTFAALARLTAAGASPAKAFSQLFEQHSLPRLHLRGRILEHVAADCAGRMLWTYVTADDFRECGAQKTDTEDAINMLLTVRGVEAAALFVELEPSVTKVSLRSRSSFNVHEVAEKFGGGGHRAAAGITFSGPRIEAQQAILDAVRLAMQDCPQS
ncbi:MAG: phosphoesterase [Planctomycetota bacterium]|nr:MAG: phosphoesterase [Planctomycetota bacterium]